MDFALAILLIELVHLGLFGWLNRRSLCRLLVAEQQLRVYKRQVKRPTIKDRDRLFWVLLAKVFRGWRQYLTIVEPQTVLAWQKRRVSEWWRRKSRRGPGRPPIRKIHVDLIKRMARDDPSMGEDAIDLELKLKFGISHSPTTIAKYMRQARQRGPNGRKSLSWVAFLQNQAAAIWACDLFVVHTVGLRAVYVFIIMHLESRKIVHFNTTEHPTLPWIKQQVRNAGLDNAEPKFLLHDNDGCFGQLGRTKCVEREGKVVSCRSALDGWLWETMGIRGIATPSRAPNANAHCERLIGTLRRSCLDHFLIWNQRHLSRILPEMVGWYNSARVHQGLHGIPDPDPELERPAPTHAKVIAIPILGGLHFDYRRAA
jgi:transposase InsO family protein